MHNIDNIVLHITVELISHVDRMAVALEDAHKEIAEAKEERQMIMVTANCMAKSRIGHKSVVDTIVDQPSLLL